MAFRSIARALWAVGLTGLMAMPALAQSEAPAPPPSVEEQQPAPPSAEEQQPAPPSAEEQQAAPPSEDQLQAFAAATVRIATIQRQAQQQMQQALEEEGLTVEQYGEIAKLARADSGIDQRIMKMIEERLAE